MAPAQRFRFTSTSVFSARSLSCVAALVCFFASVAAFGAQEPVGPARAALLPEALVVPPSRQATIKNDIYRHDAEGVHINAHGGGVLFHRGVYYLYGEYRNAKKAGPPGTLGVGCYSSTDLYNWKHEGVVMPVSGDPASDITAGCVIERPKVVFNAKTGKFVMWFHLELKGRGYAAARAALAVADAPTGPFKFVRSLRPNAGRWPMGFPNDKKSSLAADQAKSLMSGDKFRTGLRDGVYTRRDFMGGQMSRDMTLFVDDDAKGYLISSAEENYTLAIHELTPDYLDFTGNWVRVAPGGHNEAPAVVKHEGRYHLLASGCTGWDPNPARVLVADSIWGPWKHSHNPCVGVNPQNGLGPDKTWGGQSTHIFAVQGKRDAYVAMFDVWRPRPQLVESGYIWLPVEFVDGKMTIRWRSEWDLGGFDRR